jgi:hypothetical protein
MAQYLSKIQIQNILQKNNFWVSKKLKGKVASFSGRGYRVEPLADGYFKISYNIGINASYLTREQDAITRTEKILEVQALLVSLGFESNGIGFRKERA